MPVYIYILQYVLVSVSDNIWNSVLVFVTGNLLQSALV